nr:PhnA domain-containing protein [Aquimarina sp. ERC-38]
MEKELKVRSKHICELCSAKDTLFIHLIEDSPNVGIDAYVYICATCKEQIEDPEKTEANHWRCLNDSMWSEVPGVQVLAWRMLTRLKEEGWTRDLLDMMYLNEERLQWAKASGEGVVTVKVIHKDANGNLLSPGDTVVLIKDLDVKGANFTAKRGTAVRNITLVHDNAEHIEGKVDGQRIVILTKFVKKN